LLDDDARLGDGSEVKMILKDIAEEYPDVAQAIL